MKRMPIYLVTITLFLDKIYVTLSQNIFLTYRTVPHSQTFIFDYKPNKNKLPLVDPLMQIYLYVEDTLHVCLFIHIFTLSIMYVMTHIMQT